MNTYLFFGGRIRNNTGDDIYIYILLTDSTKVLSKPRRFWIIFVLLLFVGKTKKPAANTVSNVRENSNATFPKA